MTVEFVSVHETGPGQVDHQWLLRGTHSGPLMDGSAATDRTLTLPGNDVIEVEGKKIRSVDVNFDRPAYEQLGANPSCSSDVDLHLSRDLERIWGFMPLRPAPAMILGRPPARTIPARRPCG
jgi:hypothetical protein